MGARKAKGIDINLSVQHILNCGGVGSCHGGSIDGPYQWLASYKNGISYETSNPYLTCSTFPPYGTCRPIVEYPSVTISDYGSISGAEAMQKEIFNRGPIACGIDAGPILNYTTGISALRGEQVDHVVSVVGWGAGGSTGKYWIVRNSWGEYWGEMGYIRVEMGRNALHLEDQCSWAVVDKYTDESNQVHCYEGGENCQ